MVVKPSPGGRDKKKKEQKTGKIPAEEELLTLLDEYKDVFPNELPKGPPPEREVKMNIKLKPNAEPKVGPIYKLSRAELDEMKK